ncbi:MAG: hypothetical protein PVJ21_09435 [Anaerolineales bacterium]|jgi:hypothetical protein
MRKLGFGWRIYFVALVLRLIPVLLTHSLGIGLDDMFQYDMLGRSLAAGNGFRWYAGKDLKQLEKYVEFDLSNLDYDPARGVRTSFRAPLYPAFLSVIYFITGAGMGRYFAARLVQAGLNASLAPLTYLVSRRLFPDNKPASVISAWIIACYPLLIIYPIGLATENLFFLLVLASFFFLLKISDSQTPIPDSRSSTFYSLLSGLFLSLAILTRSVILPFAGLAVLWTWLILKQKRPAILMAVTVFILVSPWVIRNSILHHRLTGVESSMGYNLYVGYHPDGDGSFVYGPSLDLLTVLDDAQRDRLGTQKAMEFIRGNPGRILPLALNRLGFFFGLDKRALMYLYSNNLLGPIHPVILISIAVVFLLPFVILAPSAALGLSLVRPHAGVILLYLLLFAYILPHVLILSEDRFHLALLPFLAIFSAQAWTRGGRAFAKRWCQSLAGKVAISLGILIVILLFVNWGFELSRDADKIAALLGPNGNRTFFPY